MFYGSCESYEKVRMYHHAKATCTVCLVARLFACYCACATILRNGDNIMELQRLLVCEGVQALKGEENMTDALLRNAYGDDPLQRRNAVALTQYINRCTCIMFRQRASAVVQLPFSFQKR